MRVLLIEDDPSLALGLRVALTHEGFATDLAQDGVEGEFLGSTEPYDVIILDLGLPGRSGLDVLTEWRDRGIRTPVMVLSARDSSGEKVIGLKAGADDYLGKPFDLDELIVRLDILVRGHSRYRSNTLTAPGLRLDVEHQSIRFDDGSGVTLTGVEYRLLHYMMLNQGKLLSKSRLIDHIYEQGLGLDSNLIEVYVRRLRVKIGQRRIVTRRGQGYIFS